MHSSQSSGRLGVIVTDDKSAVPFEVKLVVGPPDDIGKKNWYMAKRLNKYTGPPPPPGLHSLLEPMPGGHSASAAAAPRAADNMTARGAAAASGRSGPASTFPLSLPLPTEQTTWRRLVEGDLVVLAEELGPVIPDSDWCLGGSQADGRLAVVEHDDGSSVPFRVKLLVGPPEKVGATNWYTAAQLLRYTGPRPPAGMQSLLQPAAASARVAVGGAGAAPISPAGASSSSASFSMGDSVTLALAPGVEDPSRRVLGPRADPGQVATIIALENGGGSVTVQLSQGDTNRIGKRSVYTRAELRLVGAPGASAAAGGAGGAGGGAASPASTGAGGWAPLRVPLPTTSRRPVVGDLVVLAAGATPATSGLVLGESQAEGRLGQLVEDARDHQPFQVKLVVGPEGLLGKMHWYYEREVAVYTGTRPPAGVSSLT